MKFVIKVYLLSCKLRFNHRATFLLLVAFVYLDICSKMKITLEVIPFLFLFLK